MIASYNGHVDVVNVLLQHGASVHLQNKVKLIGSKGAHLSVEGFPQKHDCILFSEVYTFCDDISYCTIDRMG